MLQSYQTFDTYPTLQRGGRHAGLRRSHLHVDGVEGVWSALDEEASVRNLGSAAK
jgi:hypothetical protein